MHIHPLYDRVLVKRLESQTKTASGIIIPDSAQEKPAEGQVVAIGSGTRNDKGELTPLHVKVGDIVLFAKWGSNDVKIDGVEYLIMKESDILAIVKK